MGRKIEIEGPAGTTSVSGSFDAESRTVHTDDGKAIHLGNNDRATVHPECFVATAVYGSLDAPEVEALRAFRDQVLLRSPGGHWIVSRYYRVGPKLARHVGPRPTIRSCVKAVLDVLVLLIAALRVGEEKPRT